MSAVIATTNPLVAAVAFSLFGTMSNAMGVTRLYLLGPLGSMFGAPGFSPRSVFSQEVILDGF